MRYEFTNLYVLLPGGFPSSKVAVTHQVTTTYPILFLQDIDSCGENDTKAQCHW